MDVYSYIILPLIVFFARIVDVSLGTLRALSVTKGRKALAPIIGFVEITIWIFVINEIFNSVDNIFAYLAYGAGFAVGTYVGMRIEEKFMSDTVIIRAFPKKEEEELLALLHEKSFGVTKLNGEGSKGPVSILMIIVDRANIATVTRLFKRFDRKMFYSIERVNFATDVYGKKKQTILDNLGFRKGK